VQPEAIRAREPRPTRAPIARVRTMHSCLLGASEVDGVADLIAPVRRRHARRAVLRSPRWYEAVDDRHEIGFDDRGVCFASRCELAHEMRQRGRLREKVPDLGSGSGQHERLAVPDGSRSTASRGRPVARQSCGAGAPRSPDPVQLVDEFAVLAKTVVVGTVVEVKNCPSRRSTTASTRDRTHERPVVSRGRIAVAPASKSSRGGAGTTS
jgi:hypothetical protein